MHPAISWPPPKPGTHFGTVGEFPFPQPTWAVATTRHYRAYADYRLRGCPGSRPPVVGGRDVGLDKTPA